MSDAELHLGKLDEDRARSDVMRRTRRILDDIGIIDNNTATQLCLPKLLFVFVFESLTNGGLEMVEETLNSNTKTKANNNKPKSVYSWNVTDVQKWLRRHCTDYYHLYVENFIQHDITGRTLLRINDNSLLRLGITNASHREVIWRQILKLRLKTDIMEIRDLQRRNTNNMFYEYSVV